MIEMLFFIICVFIAATTFITLFNLLSAPSLKKKLIKDQNKKISVCIPARNEENNIKNIVQDIFIQSYSNIEILVLNDNSEDNTGVIVDSLFQGRKNAVLISGSPLPPGWTGKNWACHQLSQKARGDILLFIDADTRLSPLAVESSIAYMKKYSLSLLSAFPSQKMKTFSEILIVPLMDWILLTFLPLRMVYISSRISFVAANGQFIAMTKEAYKKTGGHSAVAKMVVEDMELARNIKKNKLKMMTFTGNNGVSCRMYNNLSEAFDGFTKNFFPGFNTGKIMFSVILIFLNIFYTVPFILSLFYKEFFFIIILILLQRIFISLSNKQNLILNAILHPVQMVIMTMIGINSMRKFAKGNLKWKGRQL